MRSTQWQTGKVLEWLLLRGPITPMEALRAFGCFRLAARIFELRQGGHNIATTYVYDGERTYARYVYLGRNHP